MEYFEKGSTVLCKEARLKYRFINAHPAIWSIAAMCRALNVTRAGFYVWLHCLVSVGEKDNQRLLELIRNSYALRGGVYGNHRFHCDLREIDETYSSTWAAKIMKKKEYGFAWLQDTAWNQRAIITNST